MFGFHHAACYIPRPFSGLLRELIVSKISLPSAAISDIMTISCGTGQQLHDRDEHRACLGYVEQDRTQEQVSYTWLQLASRLFWPDGGSLFPAGDSPNYEGNSPYAFLSCFFAIFSRDSSHGFKNPVHKRQTCHVPGTGMAHIIPHVGIREHTERRSKLYIPCTCKVESIFPHVHNN